MGKKTQSSLRRRKKECLRNRGREGEVGKEVVGYVQVVIRGL